MATILDALASDLDDRLPRDYRVARFNNGHRKPGINVSRVEGSRWDHRAVITEDPDDPEVLILQANRSGELPDAHRIDLRHPRSLDWFDALLRGVGLPLANLEMEL